MLRWLLIVNLIGTAGASAADAPVAASTPAPARSQAPAPPAAPDEAEILWIQAREKFVSGDIRNSLGDLKRLVSRFPSHPHALDAYLVMGRIHFQLKQFKEAIPAFRHYIRAFGTSPQALEARAPLAQSYLAAGKPQEAYLTTLEILNAGKGRAARPELRAEAMLLEAEALLAMGQILKSERIVGEVKSKQADAASPAQLAWMELELKNRKCARLAAWSGNDTKSRSLRLTEDQARDQIERRGTCLEESALLYRNALKRFQENDLDWIGRATRTFGKGIGKYEDACSSAPLPASGKRTARQASRYKIELAASFRPICRSKYLKLNSFISTWKEALPPKASPQVDQIRELLQKLSQPGSQTRSE